MSFYLSSKNKIKSSKEFDLLFSKGKRLKSSGFFLVFLENGEASSFRVGFSVGKKAQPLAVDRNKTKRVLREAFDFCANKFSKSFPASFDLMFVYTEPRPPSFSFTKEQINCLLLSFYGFVKER